MLSDDEQAAFLDSIKRVQLSAVRQLSQSSGASFAINFSANLHRAVDKVVRQAGERGPKTDCKAGCDYCCTVRVEASEPEVFLIARELRRRPTGQVDALLERLRDHAAATRPDAARSTRTNCAFLENHLCSIYEVRPAVCRKGHSLSAEQCRNFAPEIAQNLEILLGADALVSGTSGAYRQVNLCASAHELCRAVLLALSDETAEARWYEGESVFD